MDVTEKKINDERFKEFLADAEDILNSMANELLKLEHGFKKGRVDTSVLNSIFRSAHSLKGMSHIWGLKDMTSLNHTLEDLLDSLRLGNISLTDDVLRCIINTHELLCRIVATKGRGDFSGEIDSLIRELTACLGGRQERKDGTVLDSEFFSMLTDYERHRLKENLNSGRNIFLLDVTLPVATFDKEYESLTGFIGKRGEIIATVPSSDVKEDNLSFKLIVGTDKDRDRFAESIKRGGTGRGISISPLAEDVSKVVSIISHEERRTTPEPVMETLRSLSNTVRVDIGKLDSIMNIVGELSVLKKRIAGLSVELKNRSTFSFYGVELSRIEKILEKRVNELRDGLLGLRMIPIGHLFGRFKPFLKKLSIEKGKEVSMVTSGDDTELDKLIVEELADPLMHLLRNVVDHAIEPSSRREAMGKPRAGTIKLSAYQKGNHVVIEVEDDGAGIDVDMIKRKAVKKGIISKEYAERLSENEVLGLIFQPGFSTRDKVSKVSGRGVGLDVVRENITGLSGIIDIETEKGRGTKFILTIPITLAIIQALIVMDGGERYAVPLNSVLEVIEIRKKDIRSIESSDVIVINNRTIPLIRLARFMGRSPSVRDRCYGIVAGLAEHRLCIVVDDLIEEQDVVIKPLSRILNVPGIAGAADMGEKGTVVVVDVTGILEMVLKERKAVAGV